MNKQMRYWYRQYKQSTTTELWQAYKTGASKTKLQSYESIKERAKELNAIEPVRILSHNTYKYTCGYVYPSAETGELIFRVETGNNTYEASL